ncbi:hypothetical protein MIT9_P0311 [Methylomarinovum caldicuralii]|uniref:GGDEF domain-containing protein n=1 Tax=Methylomarinovum caldicuralii TaxID=438856 RepID=A0AAU9CCT5_9GAMM|nr:sensor domain-containing diguanylate cyclase [Methylomarinovum caldicuralii]BCX80735.1 hypothetical protein MIT9_P0311 [Methylomarinovum caldicuralii]
MSDTAGLIAFYRMRLEIQKALSRFCSETELCQQICDAAVATGEIQLAWIGLRRQSRLRPVAAAAQPASLLTRAWPCPDIGLPLLASRAVATRTPQWLGRGNALPPGVAVAGFSSACALPLTIEGDLYGVMEFYARPADFFTPERQALLADLPAEVEAVLGQRADLQRRNHQLRRIAALAYRDPLTGLPNRRYLEVYLPRVLAKARRKSRPLALFMMDLDGFKGVNDRFGHATGDRLLIQVAGVLRGRLRRGDLLVRLGGDEFVAVVGSMLSPEDDARLAADLIGTVAGAVPPEQDVGLSIGIARYPEHGTEAAGLLQRADQALYRAKADGRRCWRLCRG